ncbi:MAG: YitT family protein [Ardenticatenaceae bacterium]|nr:YitT family protein [Ardenticatenaceae bacterium]
MKRKMAGLVENVSWQTMVKDYFLLTIGAVISAVNFNLFMVPSELAPGGISGITLIIHHFTGWSNGLILMALAVPVLILGFKYLGRFRFLTRTLYLSLVSNVLVDVLAQVMPAVGITQDLLLNALFGGIVGGVGYGIVLRGRATSAGTGIITRVIQLKTGMPSSQLYMVVDGGVIVALGLTFGWDKALYSMIMLFVFGLAADYMLEGPSVIRTIFIVTDEPEKVGRALIERLHIGVTSWPVQGMFTGRGHTTLFCTVRRTDVETLKLIVGEIDGKAFVVIGQGHQARGGVWQRSG